MLFTKFLTDDHQGELESLLDRFAVHLVGQIGKADVAWGLQAGKLQIERAIRLNCSEQSPVIDIN